MGLGSSILGVGAVVIGFLWMRVKSLKRKAQRESIRADIAERRAEHDQKVAKVERVRNEGQPQRIKKEVDDAQDNNFDDFYS